MTNPLSQSPQNEVSLNPSPYRIVISGYYGFDNLGDELILQVFTQQLMNHRYNRPVLITVLSQNPQKTAQKYGVSAIHRMGFKEIYRALSQADLFISGGGGLFQDATGLGSPLYYGGLIQWARWMGVPVMVWGQGLGPLDKGLSKWMVGQCFKGCERIALRDPNSVALLKGILPLNMHSKIVLTADPVWLLTDSAWVEKTTHLKGSALDAENLTPQTTKAFHLGLSLREWPTLDERGVEALVEEIYQLSCDQKNKTLRLLLFPFQENQDHEVLSRAAALLGTLTQHRGEGVTLEVEWIGATQLVSAMARCHGFIGMRFHSIILALLAQVPVYGIIYDPKVEALLSGLGLAGVSVTELKKLAPQRMVQSFDAYQKPDLSGLFQGAQENFKILEEISGLFKI
jgi:polysaccharide pyruvyl transferase CsaB